MIPKDDIGSGSGMRCWVYATLYGNTKSKVVAKKEEYFADWHPHGYDTSCVKPIAKHKDGYWYVKIRRWSTCS